ncbi:TonB-dependent receptor domain-containing protein [Flaviaesturariibacter terrae]
MRSVFLSFFFALLAFAGNAQVTGTVHDDSGKAMAGVTVSLLRDSATVVKLAVSREDGSFAFPAAPAGHYRLSASSVGFKPAASAPFDINGGAVQVPAIRLARASGELAGVTVAARKPVIEVKADKMIVNVEGTINATGNDALELLRKSPGVQVDKDDNLSVAGKNGVQVYIDGRPTPLSGTDLANYLKTLQAAQIENIEIITNPSAKYEAAGNAGIINIRLKKNKNFGFNGSVNAGYSVARYSKYNSGVSFNYRNKSINVYGNYNYNQGRNYNSMSLHRSQPDTSFDQEGSTRFTARSHGFKVGADYSLNKQSSFGFMVNGNLADPSVDMRSETPVVPRNTGIVNRILRAESHNAMTRNNVNTNFNYSFTGSKGRSFTLNTDWGYYDINTDQRQPNWTYEPNGTTLRSYSAIHSLSPTRIDISSVKYDWEQDLLKGKLSAGGKSSYTTTDNDFRRYDASSGSDVLDRNRSNRFRYKEQIHAGYVTYNRQLKGFMVQGGLRVENTTSTGTSEGETLQGGSYVPSKSPFERSYTDFFPSAAITFNKNPMKVWNLTYSRRIDRPAYQDLNPFEFQLDTFTYSKGNTNLRPQYSNSIGLSHTYKYKLTAALNFSHVDDLLAQQIDRKGSASYITKQNLAKQDVVSFNVSYPFMHKNFMSFVNVSSNYSHYSSPATATGPAVSLEAFGLNAFSQNSLKLGKTKSWTAEATAFYNAPTIYQGVFRARAMGSLDLGVQKTILQGQGTIKASVNDVLHTLQFRGYSDYNGQRTDVVARWESRQFKLNFSWRFGNKQVKAAKQRTGGAEDELKRTQGGSGGIGIGG